MSLFLFLQGVTSEKGPNLFGLFGRRVANDESFQNYSVALQYKDIKWTESHLLQFLESPKGFIPGTKMIFSGLKSKQKRKGM